MRSAIGERAEKTNVGISRLATSSHCHYFAWQQNGEDEGDNADQDYDNDDDEDDDDDNRYFDDNDNDDVNDDDDDWQLDPIPPLLSKRMMTMVANHW